MPNVPGIFDSPGARARSERFQSRRAEVVDFLGPFVLDGLRSAAESTTQSLTELQQTQGLLNLQPPQVRPPLRGLQEAFAPAPTRAFGEAPLSAFGQLERERLRRGGEAARTFFEDVGARPLREVADITGLARVAEQEGITPQALVAQPRPTEFEQVGLQTRLQEESARALEELAPAGGALAAGKRAGLGLAQMILEAEELERRTLRPVTRPVGRAIAEVATEAAVPQVPRPLRALGVPEFPGREAVREAAGEVGEVAGEFGLVPSNLLPIPIADDILRILAKGVPIAARLLTRTGREATRAELGELAAGARRFLTRTPPTEPAERRVVEEAVETLSREAVEVAPAPAVGEVALPDAAQQAAHEAGRITAPAELGGGFWPWDTGRLKVPEGLQVTDYRRTPPSQGGGEAFDVRHGNMDVTFNPSNLTNEVFVDIKLVPGAKASLRNLTELRDILQRVVAENPDVGLRGMFANDDLKRLLVRKGGKFTVGDVMDLHSVPDLGLPPVALRSTQPRPWPSAPARAAGEVAEAVPVAEVPDDFVPRGTVDIQAPAPRPIGGAAETFAAPLRPFEQVAGEVVTSQNPVQRALIGRTGINPSILNDTPVGKGVTAYWRQRVAADELTDLTVMAALDPHTQRVTGLRPVIVIPQTGPSKGLVRNITPKREGASLVWQDVFSRPGDYNLSPAQRALIDDYHRMIDEVEFLRVQAGLKPRATRGPEAVSDGYFYTPRQVKGIKGTELRRPSNPNLQRHFDEAVEGRARGIDYDADFRATAELHVRQAYREIAEKQLSDHLELLQAQAMQRGERLFITPTELLPAPVRERMSQATLRRLAAERATRTERAALFRETRTAGQQIGTLERQLGRERAVLARLEGQAAARARQQPLSLGRDITARRARIVRLEKELEGARAFRAELRRTPAAREGINKATREELAAARREFDAAKAARSRALEAARRAEIAPGNIFGQAQETIPIAQWRNRFFRREEAEQLREGIEEFFGPQKQSPFVTGTLELGNFVRFLASVGDFAEPFIQGQLVFGADPAVWAKSALRHYQAFFDPSVQSRIVRDFLPEFQEMAAHGTPIGDAEFFAALRPGQGISPGKLLEFVPKGAEARHLLQQGGKQTFGRFQASYNTGLGSSRAMLTRALQDTITDAAERQAFVRNVTGGLDSRALGVGPGQRAVEGFLGAFSPRLLRSTVALMGDLRLGLRNPKGRAAWTSLARLVTATTGLYVLSGLALGKSWDEIKTGLNPLEGKKFLSHEINGDWIGIGGQTRSIVHLLSQTAAEPEGLLDWDQFDNPLIAFYMSRGAPALGILGGAAEAVTGGAVNALPYDEIESVPDFFKHVGMSALPFVIQGVLEGESAVTSGAALTGARTSAETPGEELARRFEQREGRPYNRETDRAIVETKYSDLVPLLFQSEGRQTVETALEGPVAALAVRAQDVRNGVEDAGRGFRNAYSDFRKIAFGASLAAFAGVDFQDPTSAAGKLRAEYHALDPFSPEFKAEGEAEPDWFAFNQEQDRIIDEIDKLAPGFKQAQAEKLRLPAELQDIETRLLQADAVRDQLEEIGEFEGLGREDRQKVRELRAAVSRGRDEAFADPARRGRDLASVDSFIERVGEERGDSTRIIDWTRALNTERHRALNYNPEWVNFIGQNEAELRTFYPEVFTRRVVDELLRR